MPKLSSLSIFFPAFNEAANLPYVIARALEIAPQVARQFEIIIINDGSSDDTVKVAKSWMKKDPRIKLISHRVNKGYGAALRSGLAAAQYDWVFWTDADGQFELGELPKLVTETAHCSAVLGYRQRRAEGLTRVVNARLFKWYIDTLFQLRISDIDCAFKLVERSLLADVHFTTTGAVTTTELLVKLKRKGVTFHQLPVSHHPRLRGRATGAQPSVILKAGWEALKLRWELSRLS